jgi:guanine nucleotide exchange factor
MSVHEPQGSSVCVHAVCVTLKLRRKGIALGLLKEYLVRLERARQDGTQYERVLLITHEDMRGLYEKAGFEWLGKSDVTHGSLPWYEMRRVLESQPARPAQTPSIPPGLWEAFQASSTRARPTARLLGSYANGIHDVTEQSPSSSATTNKFDLLCPRQECGSVILKNGVATLVERESLQLEPPNSHGILEPLPDPPSLLQWWRVTPNAMAFENIGVSKSIVREGLYCFTGCL